MIYSRYIRKYMAATAMSAGLAVAGCSSDFDPDIEAEPVAVLNVMVQPDSLVTASVSHSWLFGTDPGDVTVGNASVRLTVNGEPQGLMTFDPAAGIYRSSYRAAVGDDVEIAVRTIDYGEAAGSTVVPRKVRIDRWECTPTYTVDYDGIIAGVNGGDWSYAQNLELHYSITFTDPADEENYYLLAGKRYYEFGGGVCDDPILGENETPLEAVFAKDRDFMVFSDRSISGKSYTLSYTTIYSLDFMAPGIVEEDGRMYDRIRLYSITKDYYLYLLSLYKKYGYLNNNLENLGLAEPKGVFTNVSPGVGIVASQTPDMVVNDIYDIYMDFWNRTYN
ncbi:MAG: DUF4249 domain-containing protein [Pseudoflavonifractor sp.]|nr:DUF4249 domain-containing protein [Pseudoflavonifractor sp.]